jgi:hypothetical protein
MEVAFAQSGWMTVVQGRLSGVINLARLFFLLGDREQERSSHFLRHLPSCTALLSSTRALWGDVRFCRSSRAQRR